jgi:hypothetical protein
LAAAFFPEALAAVLAVAAFALAAVSELSEARFAELFTPAHVFTIFTGKQCWKEIAEKAVVSEKLILRWVSMADLFHIKGIGEEYADLIQAAAVDTVHELVQLNAENPQKKLAEVSEAKKLVRRVPTQGKAKKMGRAGQTTASCSYLLTKGAEVTRYYLERSEPICFRAVFVTKPLSPELMELSQKSIYINYLIANHLMGSTYQESTLVL